MGITRSKLHKRRSSGGKRKIVRKKRNHELGRQPSRTAIGKSRIRIIRVRGGNKKYRALRLQRGNFSWASEQCTRKTQLLLVAYNATSNELVRTNMLVKGAIVQIDALPFKKWYEYQNAVHITKTGLSSRIEFIKSKSGIARITKKQKELNLDPAVKAQLFSGRLLARITSRPGQIGRVDGYILEGPELAFYARKIAERKKKSR